MKQVRKITLLLLALMWVAASCYAQKSKGEYSNIYGDSVNKYIRLDKEEPTKGELNTNSVKQQSVTGNQKHEPAANNPKQELDPRIGPASFKRDTTRIKPAAQTAISKTKKEIALDKTAKRPAAAAAKTQQVVAEVSHFFELRHLINISFAQRNYILELVYSSYGGLQVVGRYDSGRAFYERFRMPDTAMQRLYMPVRNKEKEPAFFSYPVIAFGNSGRLWIMKLIDRQHVHFDVLTLKHLQKIDAVTCDSAYKNIMVLGSFESTQLLYRSNNGGKTWDLMPVVYSQRTLSRGVVMASAITGVIFGFALIGILSLYYRRRKLMAEYESTIYRRPENELRISHDAPITEVKDDLLDFRATAEAIAGLMRNPDTIPPMTIVLSGSWGSGKSSLMGMIKEQLPKERFTSLWFNAWHLQGETSMLATFILSLMNGIKSDYGIAFKAILFKNRLFGMSLGKQCRFWVSMGVLFPIAILGMLKLLQPLIYVKDLTTLPLLGLYGSIFDYACSEIMKDGTNTTGNVITGILTTITSIAGILFLQKDTPRFIGSFINLLPVDDFKMTTTQQPPGYREQFKKEFWEVVRASNPDRRIVVFIDDLDRVEGGRVLEILETINFITDIASRPEDFSEIKSNLFFVMAMATEEVAKNVGAQLEAIYDSEGKKDLVLTGSRFLEKMVQLTVAVPTMNAKDNKFISRMVIRDDEEATKTKRKSSKPEKEETNEQ